MSRAYKVERFPLNVDTTANPVTRSAQGYRHVFIANLPADADGLVTIGLDTDRAEIPVYRGDKHSACDGKPYDSVAVASPALSGELVIILANDDAVPFGSARGGASAATDRILDLWWLPHQPALAGDALNLNGLAAYGVTVPMLSIEKGGLGADPQMNVRGHRCGRCLPGGGSSGVMLLHSFAWQRAVTEAGGFGATLAHAPGGRSLSYRVAAALRCESAAVKGLGSGLQIAQGRGTQENLSGGNAGFGIVADGNAGGWWQFVARAVDAGPLTITEALPIPAGADRTRWGRFAIELIEPDPLTGQDGKVTVYANRVPILSFTDMSKFPPALDGVGSTGYDCRIIDEGADADSLAFSHVHQAIAAAAGGDE